MLHCPILCRLLRRLALRFSASPTHTALQTARNSPLLLRFHVAMHNRVINRASKSALIAQSNVGRSKGYAHSQLSKVS